MTSPALDYKKQRDDLIKNPLRSASVATGSWSENWNTELLER